MLREKKSRVPKSEALYERALSIIPWGTQTGSKRPLEEVKGFYPPYIQRGKGAYVFDLDGNRYLDYKLGCGPIILGHAYPSVNKAVTSQIEQGTAFGSAHPLEVQVAEELIRLIPCAEMIRFLKTGAEGTAAAVRLARAFTGRDRIVSFGYHGWHDWCGRGQGIPKPVSDLTIVLPYDDLDLLDETLRQNYGQVAGVIVTPPVYTPQQWRSIHSFLRTVRDLSEESGALLIFDEVVTGFRVALGGVQERFGVIPDLAVFSKGLANGYPLSAVVGTRDVMETWEENAVISSTFAGETASLAAALATVREFERQDVVGHIQRLGQCLIEGINEIAQTIDLDVEAGGCPWTPCVLNFIGQDEDRNREKLMESFRQLLSRGIMPYNGTRWYLSFSHSEKDVEDTLQAIGESLEIVKQRYP
jgi:glutamate-1-semialdehyde aminotransferase